LCCHHHWNLLNHLHKSLGYHLTHHLTCVQRNLWLQQLIFW
jgi:hypothetical protein